MGYLLEPLGLGGRDGSWAYANLGVPAALVVGFVGYLLVGLGAVRRQEHAQVVAGVRAEHAEAAEPTERAASAAPEPSEPAEPTDETEPTDQTEPERAARD